MPEEVESRAKSIIERVQLQADEKEGGGSPLVRETIYGWKIGKGGRHGQGAGRLDSEEDDR